MRKWMRQNGENETTSWDSQRHKQRQTRRSTGGGVAINDTLAQYHSDFGGKVKQFQLQLNAGEIMRDKKRTELFSHFFVFVHFRL